MLELKVEIKFPPNSSILSSMIYEGQFIIKKTYGNQVNNGSLQELLNNFKGKIKFNFSGDDIKNTLTHLCNSNIRNVDDFIDCLLKNTTLSDLEVYLAITNGEMRVGSYSFVHSKQKGYSFQIMKVDRYQGLSVLESGLLSKQVTLYADESAIYLFFLGLFSSFIASSDTNYYFLLYNTTFATNVFANPIMWMSIKENFAQRIREVINKTGQIDNELITLVSLLNYAAIQKAKKSNVYSIDLRLINIRKEINAYKVYADLPLTLLTDLKIYENEEFINMLENLVARLLDPASKFLTGRDKTGDGYHCYLALKNLYTYLVTSNMAFLNMFFREIHEAGKINPRYLSWVSRMPIFA